MKKVLAVLSVRGHRERLRVFLDEGETLILTRMTVAECRLIEGRELDEDELREIVTVDTERMAYDTGLRRDHVYSQVQDAVITKLMANGLLNDAQFAAFWTENREAHAPRGRALLKYELRQKGIESETVQEAVSTVDEEAGAYRLAKKRASQLRKLAGVHGIPPAARQFPATARLPLRDCSPNGAAGVE
jgi:regulatory protein